MEKAFAELWKAMESEIDNLGQWPSEPATAADFEFVAKALLRASRIAKRYAKKARKLERVLSR